MMKKRQVVAKRDRGSGRSNTVRVANATSTTSSFIRSIRYGECQKNHAASIGGYAVDGCREFMASGSEGTNDAFICAACSCHRNFHKKEVEVEAEVVCEYSPPNSSLR